jgi:hypothetical protein
MYDIIGDVHGHADALEALLTRHGYVSHGRGYRHAERETRGSLVFSENLFVAPVAIDYCHNAFI